MKSNKIYQFDIFTLDANAKVLLRGGKPVTITRKAVETLLALAERDGRVVLKEDLLKIIWPDRIVDEANLTQNIAMVRRALNVNRDSAAYIETFPGRGYRLVGPVTTEEEVHVAGAIIAPSENTNAGQPESQITPALPSRPVSITEQTTDPMTRPVPQMVSIQNASFAAVAVLVLSGMILGFVFFQRRASLAEPTFRVSEITHLRGMESQPAISPDGKRVVFLREQENQTTPQLYVQSVATAKTLWVSVVPGHYSSPTWSPDAHTLAYLRVSQNATQVVAIPMLNAAEGGQERIVAQFSPPDYRFDYRRLDWSPDGQNLVVSQSEASNQPFCLFLVNVATGEKKRLTNPELQQGGDVAPRFSPGGNSISFIRHFRRERQEVFTVPITGGTPQPLTNDGKRISDLDWSGNDLIFASNRSGEFRLWRRPNGNNNELQPLEIFSDDLLKFSIAEHYPALVYSIENRVRNLWQVDLASQQWTNVIASTENAASPQYSPDGSRICFRSDRDGEDQLWLCNTDGSTQVPLTHKPISPNFANWAPNGQQLVFQDMRSDQVHLASLVNGSWEIKTTGVNGAHPVFAPDGKWIYARQLNTLIKIPIAEIGKFELVSKDAVGSALRFSTDGKHLFFFKNDPQNMGLWQMKLATGEIRPVLSRLLPHCSTCWAPAPTGIYYVGTQTGSFEEHAIFFHRFDAQSPDRLIVKYPELLSLTTSGPFSLSPDFRKFLCVRMHLTESNVIQIEPFR